MPFTGREAEIATWPPIFFMRTLNVLIPVVGKKCRPLIFVWKPMGHPFTIRSSAPGGAIRGLRGDVPSAAGGFILQFVRNEPFQRERRLNCLNCLTIGTRLLSFCNMQPSWFAERLSFPPFVCISTLVVIKIHTCQREVSRGHPQAVHFLAESTYGCEYQL
jgi:hypothetical protein